MIAAVDIQKILKYQEVDARVFKLQREVASSKTKTDAEKDKADFLAAQQVAQDLEVQAGKAVERFNKVRAVYEQNYEKAKKLTSLDVDKLTDEQLVKVNNELDVILENLNKVEKELTNLNTVVEDILSKFEESKKKAAKAKESYKKNKDAYEKFASDAKGAAAQLMAALKKEEAEQNKEVLEIYKKVRTDKIFPVIVPLEGNACKACSNELSAVSVNELKAKGIVKCENCRRLVFKK